MSQPPLLRSPLCGPPLASAAELRARFAEPDAALSARLAAVYGPDPTLHAARCRAAVAALDRFLEAFGDRPAALYRAPARLSLNPHCDHQGAWVPYALHARELLAVVSPTADDRVEMVNVDPTFEPQLGFSVEEEIARDSAAWEAGWFRYIEAPAVVAERQRHVDPKERTRGRRATLNYAKGAVLRLRRLFDERMGNGPRGPTPWWPGLRIAWSGDIPQGGGQSSSSALVVCTLLALAEFVGMPETAARERLAEWCGEAEWFVGTRGGSGDHAAMLLGAREGLVHLSFRAPFGVRGLRRTRFPAGYELIVAGSRTRSEKAAEEKRLFNRGVFAYRFAFLALQQAMRDLGLPEPLIAETTCLGDLHTGRIPLADLYRLLLHVPETLPAAELARRFPDVFPAAARGCFDTDDPDAVPPVPLRGAALFGLGRVDRGRIMPELLERGDEAAMREFGRLMSITHDGDRLLKHGTVYTENRERLEEGRLRAALAAVLAGEERPLRDEPGFYGASVPELDRMVDAVLGVEGVLGAGLMGAGGGGYVLILARSGALEAVREALLREYYRPLDKEPDVEPWRPTAAAGRLA